MDKEARLIMVDANHWATQRDENFAYKQKEEKYRWHDLRKDPEDLPDSDYVVFAFDGASYGAAVYYRKCYHGWVTADADLIADNIIAWRYIEPLEEGEACT